MRTETNKLIADFMGKEWHKSFFSDVFIISPSNITYKFDTDWNWLMEVVEKIESIGYSVEIVNNECYIHNQNDFDMGFIGTTKIESTYDACVKFIKQNNYEN